MAQNYTRLSDYTVEVLELTNYKGDVIDLNGSMLSLTFIESIYEPYTSGILIVREQADISQYFPLIGEEKLKFKWNVANETKSIERNFRIYRTDTQSSNDASIHSMYFVSEEAFVDQSTNVSKSYAKKEAVAVVKDVFQNFLQSKKQLNVDQTKGLHSVVIPNWSPLQTINWVCSFSQHPSFVGGSFLFFENNEGFNFKAFESLMTQTSVGTFSFTLQNLSKEDSISDQIQQGKSIANVKELSGSTDTLQSLSEGLYANKYISYDNISRTYKVKEFDYKKQFDETKHLNKFKLCSDSFEFTKSDQRTSIIPTTTFREESKYFKEKSGSSSFSLKIEDTANYKTSIFSQLSARQFDINLYGDTTITCGKVIKIEMPNPTNVESKRREQHSKNTKNFLLVKCTHVFDQKSYMIVSRAVSDSYAFEQKFGLK